MEQEIKAYSLEGLTEVMKQLNQPRFRADQLFQWLYCRGVSSYDEMTNLPLSLRTKLEKAYPLHAAKVVNRQVSKDGTRKYILQFADGAVVETVAIPSYSSKSDEDSSPLNGDGIVATTEEAGTYAPKRLTVCFSTQIGCSMACSFCATGQEGFSRNLLPGEIVDQVLAVQKDFGARVSNLVAMGQGEPFLNYENTLAALRIMNNPKGLAIGARHITISTCGILKAIERFSLEPEQFTLAISLHSARQNVRDKLMPKLASSPLERLKEELLSYVARTNRRVTLEYIMIGQVNDTEKDLRALISFCSDLLCHVNLLPLNDISDHSRDSLADGSHLKASSPAMIRQWLLKLEEAHIPATVRQSKGSDIAGACGQLKNTYKSR